MKKKNIILISAFLSMMLFFTGCAQITDLSEEESDLIAAYAAESISKYNIYQKDGVAAVDLSQLTQESEETEAAEETQTGEELEEQENDENLPAGSGTVGKIEYSKTEPLAQAIGLPEGVTVTVDGFELSDYYDSGGHFSMNADDGNTYVVVSCTLTASSDAIIGLSSLKPEFYLDLGDDAKKQCMTYLDEDLSNYAASLKAGDSQKAVLLFELPKEKAETLTDLSLLVTINGETILLEL